MRTYILLYDGFASFEITLAALFMKSKGDIITVGLDMGEVISEERFKFIPHITINEVVADDVDLFIIPGGNPQVLYSNEKLYEMLIKLDSRNKPIAAICSAPIHLAKCGILKGRKYTASMTIEEYDEFKDGLFINQNVVVDGNLVTAKGNGYVDFAITLGQVMNIYEDENDLLGTIEYFKYFKEGI